MSPISKPVFRPFRRFVGRPSLHRGSFLAVAYITSQAAYGDDVGWALVALLEVLERFDSHADAAEWYGAQELRLPSNCLVPGNDPISFDRTNRMPPAEIKARFDVDSDPERAVRLWDATYAKRAQECGVFLACRPEYLELWKPRILRREDLHRIFGRVPGTQNPPLISAEEFDALASFANAAV